jgi:hypothetical protein
MQRPVTGYPRRAGLSWGGRTQVEPTGQPPQAVQEKVPEVVATGRQRPATEDEAGESAPVEDMRRATCG